MSLIKSILYGIISGISEMLPISGSAHKALSMHLFGLTQRQNLRDLLIHIAILIAVILSCKDQLSGINSARYQLRSHKSARRKSGGLWLYDYRILKAAAFPLVILLLLNLVTNNWSFKLPALALFLVVNGIALIVPEHARQGNKDARELSGFDGVMMGILGAFSVLPGISRTGISFAYCSLRGADRQKAVDWVIMLSIPAMLLFAVLDVVYIIAYGFAVAGFVDFLGCLLSGAAAYAAAHFGIWIFRRILSFGGYDWFAYYSWGVAILAFALYLIV